MYRIPVVFKYKVEKDTIIVQFANLQQLEDYIRTLPISDRSFSRKDGGWIILPKQLGKVVAFASTWSSHVDINQLPPHLKFVASKFILGEQQTTSAPSKEKTPYDILFIKKNAPPEVIKAAYKALAKKYHPDNGDTGDATEFRKIQEAYNKI